MKLLPYLTFLFLSIGIFVIIALPDSSQSKATNEDTIAIGFWILFLGLIFLCGYLWSRLQVLNEEL